MTERIIRTHCGTLVLAVLLWCSVGVAGQTTRPAGKPAGKASTWTLDCVEDFPALTADADGRAWLAVLARPSGGPEIRVYLIEGDKRRLACSLRRDGITGIDRPTIAPQAKGCVVAFAAETQDHWQVCYAYVDGSSSAAPSLRVIDAPGTTNAKPALAVVGQRLCIVWESNAGSARGIYSCWADDRGHEAVQRISADNANSNNPAVVSLEDGRVFAAWDSVRDRSADLSGAWFRGGQWAKEQRLTSDPRVERHVTLAARGDDVWLAWQAQSFRGVSVNNLSEQRIVVAKLRADRLEAAQGLFDHVSGEKDLLLRPEITFDGQGRLWLTARRSMGQHSGWQPLAWCYSESEWSEPQALWPDQGRWRPVNIAFLHGKAVAAVQRDDLPQNWLLKFGTHAGWHGEVAVVPVDLKRGPAPAESAFQNPESRPAGSRSHTGSALQTEPLAMPPTKFNLADHMQAQSTNLTRQSFELGGKRLNCYWGDLHEHTDLSVCNRAMNPPSDDLLANVRDIEQADFMALTDHDHGFDRPQWAYNGERTRISNDASRFVALIGEEWTSMNTEYQPKRSYKRYGHHNFIFKDLHFDRWFDSFDSDINPRMVWDQLKGVDFVSIPHQLADTGNCPTDWTFHDEVCQPVAEIFQIRGSYEYLACDHQAKRALEETGHYLQDAWKQGLVIGVIASPDHGGGAGRAGIWAEQLTPGNVLDALHARHTFGTSGAKFSLLVQSGDAMMGDKVARTGAGAISFAIRCVTDMPIAKVVLLRNNEVIQETEPNQPTVQLDWTDTQPPDEPRLWYYVRIHRSDNQLAWSSPIWFIEPDGAK